MKQNVFKQPERELNETKTKVKIKKKKNTQQVHRKIVNRSELEQTRRNIQNKISKLNKENKFISSHYKAHNKENIEKVTPFTENRKRFFSL